MSILDQQSPAPRPVVTGWAPLALGFRPFFLLAALAAVTLMTLWLAIWHGLLALPAHYDPLAWHSHEMLFGYAAAVIAGFLLTAVRNWTGVPTWTGSRLGLLAAVWLAARVTPWLPGVPPALPIALDVAFLPLVALSLVRPLWQGQNPVNRVFLLLLGVMALVCLQSHLQMLGMLDALGDARRVMLDLVLLVIVLVAGRVLPFFTRNVIPGFEPVRRGWVEAAAIALIAAVTLAELVALLPAALSATLWLAFAAVQFVRLAGWFDRRVLRIPVLWILHAGYAWLAVGAALNGVALLGLFPPSAAVHALTIGVVGVFTLGMMARVARGHTGRPINVAPSTTLAFVLVNLAVALRVFGPAWFGAHYALWIDLSAGLWVLAFALFAWRYVPLLLRPRVDGRPG
jgi:uncharacterized protein involved in response to NO